MKNSVAVLVILLCSMSQLQAQGGRSNSGGDVLKTLLEEGPSDRVNVEVDSMLLSNYNKLISKNMQSSGIPGYRIRIYSQSGVNARQEQQQVRARFLSLYPRIDAYNRYDESYFKIYVGDCRTKSDALKLQDQISRDFPNSFIIPDYINLKRGE